MTQSLGGFSRPRSHPRLSCDGEPMKCELLSLKSLWNPASSPVPTALPGSGPHHSRDYEINFLPPKSPLYNYPSCLVPDRVTLLKQSSASSLMPEDLLQPFHCLLGLWRPSTLFLPTHPKLICKHVVPFQTPMLFYIPFIIFAWEAHSTLLLSFGNLNLFESSYSFISANGTFSW